MANKSGLPMVGAKGKLPAPTASAPVVEALQDAERESLRAKAREHTDTMLAVLVDAAKGKRARGKGALKPSPSTQRLAANDVLIWGYGRPAVSQERAEDPGDEGMTIIIGELHLDGRHGPDPQEIDVTPAGPHAELDNAEGFAPVEFDIDGLADAPVK